jgi:hypothetical protein
MTFWPRLVLTQVGGGDDTLAMARLLAKEGGGVFFPCYIDDILHMARPSEGGWRGLHTLKHKQHSGHGSSFICR